MEPPHKRPRTGPASHDETEDYVAEDELSMNPVRFDIEQDPLYELDRGRANAASRLKSRFEDIFAKYEKDFTGIGDEIDFHTGEVVVDNGHIEAILNQDDLGLESESESASDDASEDSDEEVTFLPPSASVLGSLPEEPTSTATKTKDRWVLPEDLPDLDRLGALAGQNHGSFTAGLTSGGPRDGGVSHAPPLLDPALLQYDSFGQARMRRSLSDMLGRYKRSRLTDAKSFVQAQKLTTATRQSITAPTARNNPAVHSMRTPFGSSAPSSQGSQANHHNDHEKAGGKIIYFPRSKKTSAKVVKNVQDLRKIHSAAKVRKGQAMGTRKLKRSSKTEAAQVPTSDEINPVKRKRGRPRKIRPSGDADPSSTAPSDIDTGLQIVPNEATAIRRKRRQATRSKNQRLPTLVTSDIVVLNATDGSLPHKRAYKKSLTSRRRKTAGPAKQLATHSSTTKGKIRTITDAQRTSGRHRRQTEFYGELISTLDIEQRLLESDDEDSDGPMQPLFVLEEMRAQFADDQSHYGRPPSPDLSSQRTIPDSQDPSSSLPSTRILSGTPNKTHSPVKVDSKVIRDSQDPSSSVPIPDNASPRKTSQPSRETFQRNLIDTSYGFSDDDEDEDIGVQKGSLPSQCPNVSTVDVNSSTSRFELSVEGDTTSRHSSPDIPEVFSDGNFTSSTFVPSIESPQSLQEAARTRPNSVDHSSMQKGGLIMWKDQKKGTSELPSSPTMPLSAVTESSIETAPEPSLLSTHVRTTVTSQQSSTFGGGPEAPVIQMHNQREPMVVARHPEPTTKHDQVGSARRSPSSTLTGREDEPVTPNGHKLKDIKAKASSTFKRRILTLSRLVPDRTTRDGEEDELSTISSAKYGASPSFLGILSRSTIVDRRNLSTPDAMALTLDQNDREPSKRNNLRTSTTGAVSEGAMAGSGAESDGAAHLAMPRRRKIGFGFENARGAAPRASSATPRIPPPSAWPETGPSPFSRSTLVSRTRSDLEPVRGNSPPKTATVSPLARRTLTTETPGAIATPKNRKRKWSAGQLVAVGNDFMDDATRDDSSSVGEVVQTPGGTLRRCGTGGFTCDRDFCLVCCI